jgi:hypothetical protein
MIDWPRTLLAIWAIGACAWLVLEGMSLRATDTWDGILLRAVLWPVVALIILGAVIGS